MIIYLGSGLVLFSISIIALISQRENYSILDTEYIYFILKPWKFITFLVATGLFVGVAPYTGDPTWDRIDAGFMSILCFLTSPWVVGIVYRRFLDRETWLTLYVAVCLWLFSVSWSYDAYLLWRDGLYPSTSFSNLIVSSFIYICAGLFWNLEYLEDRGIVFSFMKERWTCVESNIGMQWILGLGFIFSLPALTAVPLTFKAKPSD